MVGIIDFVDAQASLMARRKNDDPKENGKPNILVRVECNVRRGVSGHTRRMVRTSEMKVLYECEPCASRCGSSDMIELSGYDVCLRAPSGSKPVNVGAGNVRR